MAFIFLIDFFIWYFDMHQTTAKINYQFHYKRLSRPPSWKNSSSNGKNFCDTLHL